MTPAGMLMDLGSPREVLFSEDGNTIHISREEQSTVSAYERQGNTLMPRMEIMHLGLVSKMVMVTRGQASGRVLLPAVDQVGNVAVLRITGAGVVADERQLDLGPGGPDIPDAAAVQP